MATMNVSLPDAMKARVEEQVATGRYGNSSDYVRDLVRRDQERSEARAEFERLIQEGIDSGLSDMTAEEIFAEVRRLSYTQEARRDLRSIYRSSVEMFGPAQADLYRDGLLSALGFCAETPQAVREFSDFASELGYTRIAPTSLFS